MSVGSRISVVFFVGLLALSGAPSFGEEDPTFYIGHNLTPSTNTLDKGQFTVGTYAVAVGISKKLFVATSPWIWLSYNTANLHLKWVPFDDGTTRIGLFVSYFESFNSAPLDGGIGWSSAVCRDRRTCGGGLPPGTAPTTFGLNRYQWKSTSLHALFSSRWKSEVESFFSLKYSYFWNDDLPYSIRMDPGSDSIRGQLDATQLTAIRLSNPHYRLGLECGALGLNYISPYIHLGSSLTYMASRWLAQVGASYTIQFGEILKESGWHPGRFDSRLHSSQSDGQTYYFRYLQTALHPEIQLQYYF